MPPCIKRVSSIDVAKFANVSQATVSRVFSGSDNVSKNTKIKVMEAARQLNYKPNLLASALNQRHVHIIALVNPMFNTAAYMKKSIDSFTKYIQLNDCVVMLLSINEDNKLENAIEKAFKYQIDGIIILSITLDSNLVEECNKLGVPVLFFNREPKGKNVLSVCLNNKKAGYDIAKYFITRGHKRLAYISGDINSSTNKERYEGYIEAIKEEGLSIFDYYEGDFTYKSGYEAAKALLLKKQRPDAILSANDNMAYGFIDSADIDFNIKIPKDISVIGFDNGDMSSSPRYNLTTIEQPVEYMAKIAVDLLYNIIHGNEGYENLVSSIYIDGNFISRSSVLERNKD